LVFVKKEVPVGGNSPDGNGDCISKVDSGRSGLKVIEEKMIF
jgi:hypothetical protein